MWGIQTKQNHDAGSQFEALNKLDARCQRPRVEEAGEAGERQRKQERQRRQEKQRQRSTFASCYSLVYFAAAVFSVYWGKIS